MPGPGAPPSPAACGRRRLLLGVHEAAVHRAAEGLGDLHAGDRPGRAVGDGGCVPGGVRAHPAHHRDRSGGRGRGVHRVGADVAGAHPAPVDQQHRAGVGAQRRHDVDAGGTLAGLVADHRGPVGQVGAGRLDPPPLVAVGGRPSRRQDVADRDRVGLQVGARLGVGRLAGVQAVELPLPEPQAPVGEHHDGDREQRPAPAEHEPHGLDSSPARAPAGRVAGPGVTWRTRTVRPDARAPPRLGP